jgi:predicted nucleotidyltransferase
VGSIYHYTKYARPTHQQSLQNGRHAVLALLLLIRVIIDVLWPLWDKGNQALHDQFANTVVFRPSRV